MLSKWFSKFSSESPKRQSFVRPRLETLEDRLTPSSNFMGSLDSAAFLTPAESGAVGTVVGISADTGLTTGNWTAVTRMMQEIALAMDKFLLAQPAVIANPSLSATLSADANAISSALNANLATTSPAGLAGGSMAFNMALMGLTTAQANPVP